jgi:Protein of unknown function (DUF2442)
MPTSAHPDLSAVAADVRFDDARMYIRLVDERDISVPLVWFPRLANATAEQRAGWRVIGRGVGIYWEAVDEDISVPRLLGLPCD